MAPYRARQESAPSPVAPTTGLVADMVRQFADPYAFLRELIQNGIDAGARSIEVRIERSPDGVVAISVTDDGAGMTPEVIQGPLLTLFVSSKEGDTKKIGKYGVGFVSVFAIEPDEVQVSTWRDGGSWLVRLLKDFSFELTDTGPREGSGTTVTLLKETGAAAESANAAAQGEDLALREALRSPTGSVEERRAAAVAAHLAGMSGSVSPLVEHEARAVEALRTWCRHAQVPIHLTVVDHGRREEEARRTRIDEPVRVIAPFSVEEAEGDELYVVGTSAGTRHMEGAFDASSRELGETFAGLYNRGLTLYETQHPLAEDLLGIRFKVMSPRLQHTLSRDNVRRDEEFERVLARVREMVKGSFRAQLQGEVARRAYRAARGEGEKEYAAALEAALSPVLSLEPGEIAVPLTDPVSGSTVLHGVDAHVHVGTKLLRGRPLLRGDVLLQAPQPSPLTRALAREGTYVLRCSLDAITSALKRSFPLDIEDVGDVYAIVTPVPEAKWKKGDRELCDGVRAALEAAGNGVAAVVPCSMTGAASSRVAVAVPEDGGERTLRLCSIDDIRAWWGGWGRRYVMLLNTGNAIVRQARSRTGEGAGAILLARLLLLDKTGEALSASSNERLLELAGGETT